MGRIVSQDGTDEANCHIRFKGIERYHEYFTIRDFVKDWVDKDDWMKREIEPLEKPKSEARRRIDLFLRRTKHIPTSKAGFDAWKANAGIYAQKVRKDGE